MPQSMRTALRPLIGHLMALPAAGQSSRAILEAFTEAFAQEVGQTGRADIVQSVIAEAARFSTLLDFYYRRPAGQYS